MSSMGKQKYIFAPPSFGASISTRDRILSTGADNLSQNYNSYMSAMGALNTYAAIILDSTLDSFILTDSYPVDPIMALMGDYWAIDGVGGAGEVGDSRTIKKVNSIISDTTPGYEDYPLGTLRFALHHLFGASTMPVNDSYAHTQYMYIDINISELLKLSEYASSLSGETPGGGPAQYPQCVCHRGPCCDPKTPHP